MYKDQGLSSSHLVELYRIKIYIDVKDQGLSSSHLVELSRIKIYFDVKDQGLSSSHLVKLYRISKEYGIEGGPPYHMIIHALQTVLHLNKKRRPKNSFSMECRLQTMYVFIKL